MKHLLLSLIALPAAAGLGTLPARRIDLNPSAGVKTGLGLPVFQRASSPRMTVTAAVAADATAAKAALRVALASADGEPKSPAVTAAIAELEQFCVAEPAVSPLWVGHWKVCFPRQLFETQLALVQVCHHLYCSGDHQARLSRLPWKGCAGPLHVLARPRVLQYVRCCARCRVGSPSLTLALTLTPTNGANLDPC